MIMTLTIINLVLVLIIAVIVLAQNKVLMHTVRKLSEARGALRLFYAAMHPKMKRRVDKIHTEMDRDEEEIAERRPA